ncbi:MAG: hypothetical protein RL210_2418 [Pseudomonadota bacterium]
MQTRFIPLLCVLALGGCAGMSSDPYIRGLGSTSLQRIDDEQQRDKLSYLARYLLTADDRQRQSANIKNVHPGWTEFNTHGALSMATSQALTGNMLSNSGTQVYGATMAALTVASMLMPDGSMENVSGFYLPPQFNGATIDNEEQARNAFWQWRERQIAAAAQSVQREFRCVFQCDSKSVRIYELRLASGQSGSNYIYNPPILYIRAELYKGEMVPAADDPLLSWALGFTPRWATPDGNTAPITLMEASLDKEGKPEYKDGDPLINHHEPFKTTLGRNLVRQIYAGSDYDFIARRGFANDYMAFRGDIYTFVFRHYGGFIEFKRVEKIEPPVSSSEKAN